MRPPTRATARVTGPHVWLDCYSTRSHSDDGPHHRWATGLLFDNVHSRALHVENRQSSGTGHGWSGAQVLFWSGLAEGIRCDAPRGAMSWTVGSVGAMREGNWAPGEPFGYWEAHNRGVMPRSLYLQQLRDRLGPAAVEAVTLPAQREGRIWAQLAGWAGEGRLESGHRRGHRVLPLGVRKLRRLRLRRSARRRERLLHEPHPRVRAVVRDAVATVRNVEAAPGQHATGLGPPDRREGRKSAAPP